MVTSFNFPEVDRLYVAMNWLFYQRLKSVYVLLCSLSSLFVCTLEKCLWGPQAYMTLFYCSFELYSCKHEKTRGKLH